MDMDRFWHMIDQARAAAGPEADQAIRDFDDIDPDPERDYWDLGDLRNESWIVERLEEASATAEDESDIDDEDDDLEDDEEDIADPVALGLYEQLTQLPASEIGGFDNLFEQVRATADTPAMVVAAQLIEHGFLGDDSFDDFRAGLVALGRQAFEAAVANPDSLADHPLVREIAEAADPRWLGREDLIFVASHAYATVTGEDEITFFDYAQSLLDAAGEEADDDKSDDDKSDDDKSDQDDSVGTWQIEDEAETRQRLPRLSELFYARSIRNRARLLSQLDRPA